MKTNQLVIYEAVLEAPTETAKGYTELRGRAVPYGVFTNRGWFLESVRYGAFDKSIRRPPCDLLLTHMRIGHSLRSRL